MDFVRKAWAATGLPALRTGCLPRPGAAPRGVCRWQLRKVLGTQARFRLPVVAAKPPQGVWSFAV